MLIRRSGYDSGTQHGRPSLPSRSPGTYIGGTRSMLLCAVAFMVSIPAMGCQPSARRTSPSVPNSPWPMYGHDARRTGRSPYTGRAHAKIRWTFRAGGPIVSSPAVGRDGTIYFTSAPLRDSRRAYVPDDYLYAVSRGGRKKWAIRMGKPLGQAFPSDGRRSSPAIGLDGPVYCGSLDGSLYAITLRGAVAWSFKTKGRVASSPAIDASGTIYFGSDDGTLYALDKNGRERWRFRANGKIASSPALGRDGAVYFNTDRHLGGTLYALTPRGARKWAIEVARTRASPVVGDDGTIYVSSLGVLRAFHPNGQRKWFTKLDDASLSSPVVARDGTLRVASGHGAQSRLHALDVNGTKRWASKLNGTVWSPPAIDLGGTVYILTYGSLYTMGGPELRPDIRLYAIDSRGRKRWALKTGAAGSSSPAIGADGTLYFGCADGKLYAVGEK